jgi:hypothetical protein
VATSSFYYIWTFFGRVVEARDLRVDTDRWLCLSDGLFSRSGEKINPKKEKNGRTGISLSVMRDVHLEKFPSYSGGAAQVDIFRTMNLSPSRTLEC